MSLAHASRCSFNSIAAALKLMLIQMSGHSCGDIEGGRGQFDPPIGIAVDASGNVLVADTNNARIEEFSPPDAFHNLIGTPVKTRYR